MTDTLSSRLVEQDAIFDLCEGALRAAEADLPLTTPTAIAWRPFKEAYSETGATLAHIASARF